MTVRGSNQYRKQVGRNGSPVVDGAGSLMVQTQVTPRSSPALSEVAAALEVLSTDADVNMRMAVVCHLACPSHVLPRLSRDTYSPVRRQVALRDDCSPELLATLSQTNR